MKFYDEDVDSTKYEKGATLLAVTIMSNHSHELFYVENQVQFSNQMRRHHARYGCYFNRSSNRCGKVAQDRAHTTLIGDPEHEMEVVFYIHANPLRANIVKDPKNYYWSTHRLYAFGKREAWMTNIKLPKWYLELGRTNEARQKKYRKLFARYLQIKGLRKQRFLKARFFGQVTWVIRMEEAIQTWKANQKLPP